MAERPHGPGDSNRPGDETRDAFRYMDVGWSMLASVTGGLLGGWLLDRWLHTGPWLLVTGALRGIAIGLYELIMVALKAEKRR